MGIFNKLFRKSKLISKSNENKNDNTFSISSGELITEWARGENLVEGRQTWELAEEKKDDIEYMKKCCDAELKIGLVPAPYYFERVAILSRKAKNYEQEVAYCEKYIQVVDEYYKRHSGKYMADVRKGPRYKSILKRLPKAKELLAKQRAT